jgi:GNAT superfamily N-acetyltransferase
MIKEFSVIDFQKVCEVFMITFNESWNDKWSIETARIYLQELLDNKRFVGFTAWENDLLIGFAFCHMRYNWRGDDITIDLMGISPDHQRKGYGEMLINAVEKFSREHSLTNVGLFTNFNTSAFNFYKKLGFKNLKDAAFMGRGIK